MLDAVIRAWGYHDCLLILIMIWISIFMLISIWLLISPRPPPPHIYIYIFALPIAYPCYFIANCESSAGQDAWHYLLIPYCCKLLAYPHDRSQAHDRGMMQLFLPHEKSVLMAHAIWQTPSNCTMRLRMPGTAPGAYCLSQKQSGWL